MTRFGLAVLVALVAPAFGQVTPTAYDLTLAPDVVGDRFSGSERIELDVRRPTRVIELDAVGLHIARAALIADGTRRRMVARQDGDKLLLEVNEPIPRGRAALELVWRGRFSHDLRGIYRVSDGSRHYVLTQLEPEFARRVFPCFDQPALRARFRIHVVAKTDDQVISNGPLERETRIGSSRIFDFAETPPIPTYLVAIAVGEFDAAAGLHGAVPVRVLAQPGHRTEAAEALRATLALLDRLETYLGVPFPFAKLDVVAAPELAINGMENAGAIFIRADQLLRADENQARKLAHELAHQWFGDLVTMSSWRDLWLSESLARFLEFDVISAWRPDWTMWTHFRQLRDRVLGIDARSSAHAIRRSGQPAFDEITYDKGAAALSMLRDWMGPDEFRAALHEYLVVHALGSVDAGDFWRALADHSSDEIVSLGASWFDQPGHPLVEIETHCRDGALRIDLSQRRDGQVSAPQIWRVPVTLVFASSKLRLLLDHPRESLLMRDATSCPSVQVDDDEWPFRVRYLASSRRASWSGRDTAR